MTGSGRHNASPEYRLLSSEDAGHRDWQNVRKNNLQNTAKEPEKPTTTIDTLSPIWTLSFRGVLTFVASSLNINGCMLWYFEGTTHLHCYTSCILSALHCSQVSFLQCCHMTRYTKIFMKCEGVYSLLWYTVSLMLFLSLSKIEKFWNLGQEGK